MSVIRLFFTILKLLTAVVLLIPALDWRSPFLASFRFVALMGLIPLCLILILAEIRTLWTSCSEQRVLRAFSSLALVTAVLAFTITLGLEARFHWTRFQVLRADPHQLEKLGRHVIVGYHDPKEVRELVKLRAVAGVFLSGRNVQGKSIDQVRQEIQSFQDERLKQSLPPLWIATDQEGGMVARLSPPLPQLPPISEIVKRYTDVTQQEQAVRTFATQQGKELASLGINLNFAPVVDINYQIKNPNDHFTRIYRRAIDADPAVVTQVAGWYCAGLEETGVRCTLKHFPGLGRVFEDTHLSHAELKASVEDLTNTDWMPFRVLMRKNQVFTMLGHVRLTAIDPDRPVSISSAVITGMLRGDWKYDGVLITDDFGMLAMYRSKAGIDNGSIQALNAGVDLILVSYDSDQYYRIMYALLEAHRQGKLDQKAFQRSDQRLKRFYP